MNDPKGITKPEEMVSLVTRYANIRNYLWLLIATVKQVAHTMPTRERTQVLDVAMRAEEALR